MSVYTPKSVKVVQHRNSLYWVHDKFGPYSGPYATASDAVAVAEAALKEGR